jgi:hypothetical protein
MKKTTTSLVVVVLVLAVAYIGVSFYFSNQLLRPRLMTDEELKAEYGQIIPGGNGGVSLQRSGYRPFRMVDRGSRL